MGAILIVEDEYFIADDCAALARQEGYEVVGPFASVEEAWPHAREVSGAIIDVSLKGTKSYTLIDILIEVGTPITLYTGYDAGILPKKYAHISVVTKPLCCAEAMGALFRQIGDA